MNGSRLISGTDYTADGTKFTLTNPITSATDVFAGVTYQTVPIANAITQVAADARYAQFKDVSVSPFEAAKAYNQNDLVSQNGDVWSAIGAVTPGPWDANDWRSLGNELPANAAGSLVNDGTGTLSWAQSVFDTAADLRAADPAKVKDGVAMTLGALARGLFLVSLI